MQAGAFLPWFRNHYLGYDKEYQEAYAYGDAVARICRACVERRYRMLQVFYDAMYEWTQTGIPIARALFLNDPEDPAVYAHLDDQFFIGKDILVAPILFPAGHQRRSGGAGYLSAGGQRLVHVRRRRPGARADQGRADAFQHRSATRPGAGVRARRRDRPASVTPEQYVGELPENPLEICIYPGPDNEHLLYQDDGISTLAEKENAFRTTRISHTAGPRGASVRLLRLHDGYATAERFYFIRLMATRRPAFVTVGGAKLRALASSNALDATEEDSYFWDDASATTVVKVFDNAPDITVTVMFAD